VLVGNIFSRSWSSSPLLSSFILWTGDVEVRVVGEGIKGFRRGGLSFVSLSQRKSGFWWLGRRDVGSVLVASLLANKVSFTYGDGKKKAWGVCCFVLLMGGG
jgi:hypothetical protein